MSPGPPPYAQTPSQVDPGSMAASSFTTGTA
jgi:hypothetical protein